MEPASLWIGRSSAGLGATEQSFQHKPKLVDIMRMLKRGDELAQVQGASHESVWTASPSRPAAHGTGEDLRVARGIPLFNRALSAQSPGLVPKAQ
jgi:hypothetical protein